MFAKIKSVALAALIALGAVGASSAPALADSVSFRFGGGSGSVGIHIGGHGHGGYHRPGRDHGPRFCTPGRAVDKARAMGVRRAHVARVNHRVISVAGWRYGHPVRVAFARAPHCPVIR